jgi:hypothetical protein
MEQTKHKINMLFQDKETSQIYLKTLETLPKGKSSVFSQAVKDLFAEKITGDEPVTTFKITKADLMSLKGIVLNS